MDLMKLFKSLEELLYEVIVMLVFFPRTLWLALRFPQRMMDYSDTELGDVQSEQYSDTLSPPLFLMLCVAFGYVAERAVPGALELDGLPGLLRNPENLLAIRVLVFSLLPLGFSLRLMHVLGITLDRETLRAPFFAQCFVAAPLAMGSGLSQAISHLPIPNAPLVATACTVLIAGWYLRQQVRWLHRKLGFSALRGWAESIGLALLALFGTLVIAFVLVFANR